MTKLGTPIGAGPKGAIVSLGLPVVGEPPSVNCEPPSRGRLRLVAAVGGAGAETPRRRRRRRRGSGCGWRCLAAPWRRRHRGRPGLSRRRPSRGPAFVGRRGGGVLAGPSSDAVGVGEVGEAVAVVVDPVGAGRALGRGRARRCSASPAARSVPGPAGSAPAMPTPSAVATTKPASAMVSASLFLIRRRLGACRRGRVEPDCRLPTRQARPRYWLAGGSATAPRRPPTRP